MKKTLFTIFLLAAGLFSVSAQVYHFTFAYAIDTKGQKETSEFPAYSREYSVKFTDGKNFMFCMPDGSALSKAWAHNVDNGSMKITHTSKNIGRYQTTKYISGRVSGNFDYYTVEEYLTTYVPGLPSSAGNHYQDVYISPDRKQLVLDNGIYWMVYTQIPQRTITQHLPMSKLPYTPVTEPTTYPSSSTSTPATTTTSSSEIFVGSYTAFGLSQAYGNIVTHSNTFSVYKDNGGYYIKETYGKKYLNYNSSSSRFGYDVSGYNYMIISISDVIYYFRLP